MDTKIYNEEGTSSITVTGNRLEYHLLTDFWISDQPDFINALDAHYNIERILRKGSGALIYLRTNKEQAVTLIEDLDALFQEYYVEKFT